MILPILGILYWKSWEFCTPTRHFVDTSIACRALGVMPEDLLRDLESFGLFFEDMAVCDLNIYAGTIGGEVRHYRDGSGLECDAVVHLEDGRWGAVEIIWVAML